jgi:hypothetical protein
LLAVFPDVSSPSAMHKVTVGEYISEQGEKLYASVEEQFKSSKK